MTYSDPIVVANIVLVVMTGALVILTFVYTKATRKMADVMYKDYASRNTPLLDVIHEYIPGSGTFTHNATIKLINKSAVAIRVEEVLVRIGSIEKYKQRNLILGTGESRSIEVTRATREFAVEGGEGREPEFVIEVRYIGFEGGPLTERFTLPRPGKERDRAGGR